jgi:cobalt/nickel transport system permease protein
MHIPDGFLSPSVFASAWVAAAGGVAWALRRTRRTLHERMVPLMGVMAAFIFAAQMINFPVPGGTSGHLLGGVLAGVVLGPWAGSVVLALVLAVQCLVFQDGGLTALGANIVNMALIGCALSTFLYAGLRRLLPRLGPTATAAGCAWASVVLAAAACASELALSGTSPIHIVLPTMMLVHAVIGVGEALITALILGFIFKVRPDMVALEVRR